MKYISVYVNGVFYEEADDYTFDNRTGVLVFANKFNADEKVTITVAYIDNASGSIDNTYENVYERVKYYDNFSKLITSSYEPPIPVTPPRLYLYNNGDECVNVTGGWDITYNSNCTLTKETDHLKWTPSSGTMQYSCAHSHNKILWIPNQYNSVYVDYLENITVSNASYLTVALSPINTTRPYNDSSKINLGGTGGNSTGNSSYRSQIYGNRLVFNLTEFSNTNSNSSNQIDFSSIAGGEYYVYLLHYSDYSQTGYANLYSVWLE